jgi:TM2 domain-containing membrane protein YozV
MPVNKLAPGSFCSACGTRQTGGARFCSSCGQPLFDQPVPTANQATPIDSSGLVLNPNPLPPWGAALCSLIIAGLGQMLLGQVAKGVVILLIGIVVGALTAGVGAIIIWIVTAVDAYQIAKKLNSGVLVRKWEWF